MTSVPDKSCRRRYNIPGETPHPPPSGRELPVSGDSEVRASLVEMGRRKGPASSPGLSTEKKHVIAATKELVGVAKHHQYLVGQMVPAIGPPMGRHANGVLQSV